MRVSSFTAYFADGVCVGVFFNLVKKLINFVTRVFKVYGGD